MNKKFQANASYCLIHGAMWGMYAIVFAFAKKFLEELGLTNIMCSVVLGGTAAVSCLLNVLVGEMVSRIRRLELYAATLAVGGLILLGLCGMITGLPLLALTGLSVVLALLQMVPGMCNSIGMDAIARGAPATYSVARGMGSLFYALSATAAGMLQGMTNIALLSAGLCLALLVGVIWFHNCAEKGLATAQEQTAAPRKKDQFLKKNPKFSLFLVGATFLCISHFYVCTFMWDIVAGLQLGERKANEVLGLATGISAFVELPIMFGFVYLTKKLRCHVLLKFAAVMFLAKTLGLYFAADQWGIYLAQATQILGYGLYAVASVTYAAELMGKEDAVRAQSYLAATISLGNVIAMSTGGLLLSAPNGVSVMLLVATGCAAAGALTVLLSAGNTEKRR